MDRIDFYILSAPEQSAADLFTCRLAEKALGQELQVFIRVRDRSQAEALDELLWTFRQGSFVPHALVETAIEEDPVVIGEHWPEHGARDLLINLGDDLPAGWEEFQRLAEVVEQNPTRLEAARARFRQYRDGGLEPHYHKLEADS